MLSPLKRHKQLFWGRQAEGTENRASPTTTKAPPFSPLRPPVTTTPPLGPLSPPKKTPTPVREYALPVGVDYPALSEAPPPTPPSVTLLDIEDETKRQGRRQSAYMGVV